ncbi:glycerol-3-phosphate acyltransferase [Ehrlichia ruminantium]|uniref:glycerol-3-phosphate 1-O-acyltransferase PlsY n=1 Tax=Ehrlichia ruminantium TaxID=779 RepID=UPI0015DC555C|nr:glycerol-3-phosphate 1-O-acyltransferase PlsY [Ehrlichia ruminantium]QLK50091.1 glycerol-3-phosphate acyltransferase [Ehrlichia ruminantium]QLK51016.1 glycerol-3-phosphate acyltransferase [Ehrlichia ruminantium]QLK52850.1 glycerol-3-phosphate acyltransferase [Ehrlichia ruminantium]QLK58351.1 glycerol-3-phosphate acyltransferase [Ehrlichia ruminantium]
MDFQVVIFILCYLIGSIPFGFILSYVIGIGDIRKTGSGNIGATNVFRKNKKLALLTLLLDALKSFICVAIAQKYNIDNTILFLAALFAIIGHIFPVYLFFKGGKGVAPLLGSLIFIDYRVAVCFLIFWIICFLLCKYASLSSIVSTLIALLFICTCYTIVQSVIFTITALLIITQHTDNIIRMLNKSENKINLKL